MEPKARFIRRFSALSNAIQTKDNEANRLIIYCLKCIRHGRNAACEPGLRHQQARAKGERINFHSGLLHSSSTLGTRFSYRWYKMKRGNISKYRSELTMLPGILIPVWSCSSVKIASLLQATQFIEVWWLYSNLGLWPFVKGCCPIYKLRKFDWFSVRFNELIANLLKVTGDIESTSA